MLLFVCGFPSGGTDLTKSILNAHPDVYLNGEMTRLPALAGHQYHAATVFRSMDDIVAFQRTLARLNTWGNISNLNHDFSPLLMQCGELAMLDVLKLSFSERERRVWGNKTPQNTENIATLHSIFPDARFLIVIRDVRDVCLSWHRKWTKSMPLCAHKWAVRMQTGQRQAASLPSGQALFVRYEDMLTDIERVCREICSFLELPFSPRMLEHHRFTQEIPDGKLKFGERIDPQNQNKWRSALSVIQVRRIEEIAYDAMCTLGYVPAAARGQKALTLMERLSGQCNDIWASLAVGNSSSRDNSIAVRLRTIARQIGNRFAS